MKDVLGDKGNLQEDIRRLYGAPDQKTFVLDILDEAIVSGFAPRIVGESFFKTLVTDIVQREEPSDLRVRVANVSDGLLQLAAGRKRRIFGKVASAGLRERSGPEGKDLASQLLAKSLAVRVPDFFNKDLLGMLLFGAFSARARAATPLVDASVQGLFALAMCRRDLFQGEVRDVLGSEAVQQHADPIIRSHAMGLCLSLEYSPPVRPAKGPQLKDSAPHLH